MTTIDRPTTHRALPDDETLAGFRARAATADEKNEYFHEDYAILRDLGYLGAAVPEELGGWGLDLATLSRAQRRLASFAPATALAMCMHHYWIGIAVEHERFGDTSLRWILDLAAAGEVIAAGHAEVGNDLPVTMSTATAERVEGGYRFNGHKLFGSNGPVWSFLGAHALDASDPENPVIVHGFVARDTPGVTVVPKWDTLGMRPSQSYETVLDDVFVPDDRVGAVTPAGDPTPPFVAAMQLWFVGLVSNVAAREMARSNRWASTASSGTWATYPGDARSRDRARAGGSGRRVTATMPPTRPRRRSGHSTSVRASTEHTRPRCSSSELSRRRCNVPRGVMSAPDASVTRSAPSTSKVIRSLARSLSVCRGDYRAPGSPSRGLDRSGRIRPWLNVQWSSSSSRSGASPIAWTTSVTTSGTIRRRAVSGTCGRS